MIGSGVADAHPQQQEAPPSDAPVRSDFVPLWVRCRSPVSPAGSADARAATWLPADRRIAVGRVSLSRTAGRLALRSWTDRGLIASVHDPQPIRCRAALYAREAPGQRSRARLERRVGCLAGAVRRLDAWQVAAYLDCSLARPWARPGLRTLLGDAPWAFDLICRLATVGTRRRTVPMAPFMAASALAVIVLLH